jgi:hypothetical protein
MSKRTVCPEDGAMIIEDRKTRRAALCALAGVSALAIPIVTASASARPDPIFTAITRHRSAYQSLKATRFAMQDLISEREVSKAEWDAYDRAHENEDAAFDELLRTGAPETSAGMRAVIAHLISLDDGRLSREMSQLLTLLLQSRVLTG